MKVRKLATSAAKFTFFLQVGKECVKEPLSLLVIREAVLVEYGLWGGRYREMMAALGFQGIYKYLNSIQYNGSLA